MLLVPSLSKLILDAPDMAPKMSLTLEVDAIGRKCIKEKFVKNQQRKKERQITRTNKKTSRASKR